jgi:hypothetical protein
MASGDAADRPVLLPTLPSIAVAAVDVEEGSTWSTASLVPRPSIDAMPDSGRARTRHPATLCVLA